MPLNWDDDEDEELTEIEYRKRPGRVVVHEEVTSPLETTPRPVSPHSPQKYPAYTPPPAGIYQPSPSGPVRATKILGLTPAPSRDRFVAFLLDSLLGFYLYWITGWVLTKFFDVPDIGILHQSSGRYIIHILLTLSSFFFYYLLMESVFGATLGKMFCRLHVIEESGQRPSLGNVFIRNILRIVDYPLAFLVAVIAMESSPLNQRLGDRAAKTVVIKKTRRALPAVDLKHTPLASTLSRMFAEVIDLALSLTLLYSVLLLMTSKHPMLSYVLYISTPILFVAYYTLVEFFSGTSPGKALFKRGVVLDNGQAPDGTASLIRNLFRPLDYLIGYPLLVLTKRKQRLGDLAADTLVVVKRPGQRGVLISLFTVMIVVLVAYFGFTHKNSIVRKDYGLNPVQGIKILIQPITRFIPGAKLGKSVLPKRKPGDPKDATKGAVTPSQPLPKSTSDRLKLVEFYFATGPEPSQIRHNRKFRQGDSIYIFFKIEGFEISSKNEASLSEDLRVEGPKNKKVLAKPQIVRLTKSVDQNTKGILFANNINLPKNSAKGRYRVIFTVYDLVAETQFSFEKSFELQ